MNILAHAERRVLQMVERKILGLESRDDQIVFRLNLLLEDWLMENDRNYARASPRGRTSQDFIGR